MAEVAMRMRQVAFAQDIELPSAVGAVETCVRNWERGTYAPSAVYQGILVAVYGMTRPSLGLPEEREARAVDAERWGRIFKQYYAWTVRRVRFCVKDHALAEDLASEVFVRVGKSLHEIRSDDDHLHGYLAMLVRYAVSDHIRSKRVQRELLALPADDVQHNDPAGTDALSMPEAFVSERVDLVRLLRLLPEQQRQVLALKVFEGLNGNQIAVQLDMSPATVSRRYTEAVTTLRQHLTGEQVPPPEQTPADQWALTAWSALRAAAASGQRFTARDLVDRYGVPEPGSYFQWRPLFEEMKADGLIQRAGYAQGKRQAWIGTADQASLTAVAA
ncbi:RNA polymerase sigma factor [Streptomyces tendae]|uniref:RNA polymerase sigma factor n=1 Tax=Streptomyces tendae TaxID=1932 RepID=UPI00372360AD